MNHSHYQPNFLQKLSGFLVDAIRPLAKLIPISQRIDSDTDAETDPIANIDTNTLADTNAHAKTDTNIEADQFHYRYNYWH